MDRYNNRNCNWSCRRLSIRSYRLDWNGACCCLENIFGEEETEEQKRAKAKNKSLNIVERKKVYEEFENNWENICMQINDSIMKALDKPSLRIKVNNQCKTILHEYAEDCLRQTRIMLD